FSKASSFCWVILLSDSIRETHTSCELILLPAVVICVSWVGVGSLGLTSFSMENMRAAIKISPIKPAIPARIYCLRLTRKAGGIMMSSLRLHKVWWFLKRGEFCDAKQ